MSGDIPSGTMCQHCKTRPATTIETESAFAYVHGMYTFSCELCILEKQLTHAEERAREIPNIRSRIDEFKQLEKERNE